jgi:putative restriction endonuclease
VFAIHCKKYYHSNRIYITTELVALFKSIWSFLVVTTHDCKFSLPFYHLTSEHFWKIIPKQGFENVLQIRSAMRNFTQLNIAVDFAILDDELFKLMQDEKSNKILKQFLLDHYFPETKDNFSELEGFQYKIFENLENKILNDDPEEYRKKSKG